MHMNNVRHGKWWLLPGTDAFDGLVSMIFFWFLSRRPAVWTLAMREGLARNFVSSKIVMILIGMNNDFGFQNEFSN